MKTVTLFSVCISVLFLTSCNSTPQSENSSLKDTGKYIDTPFEQEYHDGYLVDANSADANKVRAIQPNNSDDIWIATKGGIFRKKHNCREWVLMVTGENREPAYDVEMAKTGFV